MALRLQLRGGGPAGRDRARGIIDYGLVLVNKLGGAPVLDRFGLRRPTERAIFEVTRAGFRTVGAANRTFTKVRRLTAPVRPEPARSSGLFDLTPTDDQRMVQETVREFAAEQLRPIAAEADAACAAPEPVLKAVRELALEMVGIPEELGGVGSERSVTTNVLVAEAMAHGDMGLAVACLAPSAVSTALVLWGDAEQQATYLPSFVGEDAAGSPAAALAVLEPRPAFDPFQLATTARRRGDGYVLDGSKALVPLAASAELFVVAAALDGVGPSLFLVESSTRGVTIESEPAMGLRAASMGRLLLDNVKLPQGALLGREQPGTYAECIHLARLAWCALAVGTGRAVLDYVIPYVNERQAFGEPVSHRQAVAFTVADIAIELDGMRLVTYRAAGRAEQGKPFGREAALARQLCTEKGMAIGSNGVQLLGGHGYVKEHPVERWYRDLRAVGVLEGGLLV